MSTFLESLAEPERHCVCGHHEGSHHHGFAASTCMWCGCRHFVEMKEPAGSAGHGDLAA